MEPFFWIKTQHYIFSDNILAIKQVSVGSSESELMIFESFESVLLNESDRMVRKVSELIYWTREVSEDVKQYHSGSQ